MLEPLKGVSLKIDKCELKHITDSREQYDKIFQEEYDSIGRPFLTSKLLNELEALALQKQALINNNNTYSVNTPRLEGWH